MNGSFRNNPNKFKYRFLLLCWLQRGNASNDIPRNDCYYNAIVFDFNGRYFMNKFQQLVSEWETEGYSLVNENLISFTNGGVFLGFHLDEVTVRRKEASTRVESYFSTRELELMKRTLDFLPALFEFKEEAYRQDIGVYITYEGEILLENDSAVLEPLLSEVYHGVAHVNY